MLNELFQTIRSKQRLPFATPTQQPDVTQHFHPVLPAKKLGKKPARVVINERAIVLYRDHQGTPRALADQCPHRRSSLSLGSVRPDGRIACAYHGWHFGAEGDATCPSQPKLKCKTTAYQVVERLGFLWVAKQDVPLSKLPDFIDQAEHGTGAWSGFKYIGVISARLNAPLTVVLDNFAEVEHVPYLHRVLGWGAADLSKVRLSTDNLSDCTDAFVTAPQRPARLGPMYPVDLMLSSMARGGAWAMLWYGMKFSPVHNSFQSGWGDPDSREYRHMALRATNVFVPISRDVTDMHTFAYVKIMASWMKLVAPLVHAGTYWRLASELRNDMDHVELISGSPYELRGMKLSRADKQLAHIRHLLQALYWCSSAQPDEADGFGADTDQPAAGDAQPSAN